MVDGYHIAFDNHQMIAIWHPGFEPGAGFASPAIGLQVDSRSEVDELCRRVGDAGHAVAVDPYDALGDLVLDPDRHHIGAA